MLARNYHVYEYESIFHCKNIKIFNVFFILFFHMIFIPQLSFPSSNELWEDHDLYSRVNDVKIGKVKGDG